MVPVVGLEPTRYRYQRILSPPRLPIPTYRQMVCLFRSITGELVYISKLFPVVVSVPGLFTAFDERIGEVAGAAFAVILHFSAMAAFVFVIHDGRTSFFDRHPVFTQLRVRSWL